MMDCESLRKGLDLLDSLSDAVHLSPALSPAELGFPEHAAEIGDRYRQANNFLSSIRQEKVWKGFKLCEAEFSYQQALPHHEACFRPMFLLCALEIHILRWSLCPSDSLFAQVVQGAQEAQEAAQEVQKALKRLSASERETFAKEYGLLEVESALIVAETTLVKAMIEFRRKNFMSAAHAMLRGYREHERVSATIQEQQSRVDRKFRQEYILSLCRHKQETESAADESLLRSLQSLIDEKTREIRGMAFDRKGEMPESVLAATRELLQAKELYKDLTGRWRSSDGHAEALVCSLALTESYTDNNNSSKSSDNNESNHDESNSVREHESPQSTRSTPATTISTSSSALSSSSACFHSQNSSSPFSRSIPEEDDEEKDQEEDDEEEAEESDAIDENVVNGARKTLFASPQKQKRVIFDRRTVDGLEHAYKHSLANNYGGSSPQKSSVKRKQISVRGSPVRRTGALSLSVRTHIAIPRLGDIARLLDLGADSVTDPRRRSEKARAHNSSSSGTSARAQPLRERKSDRSHALSSPASPSRYSSQRVRAKPLVLQPKTPMKEKETQRAAKDRAGDGDREGESDLLEAMDFETLFASHPVDIFYKHVLLCKSRLSFAAAALHVGLAMIPEQVQWMLTIIGITARPAKALCSLYSLHSCEDCPYTHLATLLLVNLDKSFLQGVLECDKESSLLLKTFKILKVEQFHALIEAQSLLKSWTAKNPLWLISSARASAENHGNSSNLLSRVDFYRRALSAEKDVFPPPPVSALSDVPHWNKFYDIHATMAKHFVSLGHWTKALSASRQLPLPSFRCDLTLHGYALLRASSAALIVQEDFNHQTKYLQLKFSEKFVCNNGGANSALSPQGSDVAPSSSSSSLSNKSDVSAMVIAMNREYGLDALLSLVSHQHISVRESSLYSRLLSFDHSLAALRRDSQHHAGESDVVAREFLSSWCWLLPLELTYIAFRADNHMQEAAHSQMLQLCDKGALLFAEKYLHSNSTRGEEAQRHFCQLKDLVSALVIDELAMRDSLLLKKAVAPSCKLSLSYEQTIFSRAPSLRIIAEDPQGEHDPTILLNSLLNNGRQDISKGFQSVLQGLLPGAGEGLFSQSAGSEQPQTKEQKAMKLLKKIVDKQTKTSSAISDNFHMLISQQITDFQTVLNDQSSDDLVGEIVLLWLLVRGLILVEMNRVWEAVVMFKLIESLKDIAPRSKFAIFIAYFELAHLVATFDLCDNPLVIGTEYLKRSAISMQRALDKNCSPYISEYSELIQDLAITLQQS